MFVLLLSQIEHYLVFLCRPVRKYLDFSVSELASDCFISLLFNVERIVFRLPRWLTLIPCPKTAYSVSELTPSGTLACAESIPQLGFPVKSGASVDPMPEKPQSLSPVTLVACPTEQP